MLRSSSSTSSGLTFQNVTEVLVVNQHQLTWSRLCVRAECGRFLHLSKGSSHKHWWVFHSLDPGGPKWTRQLGIVTVGTFLLINIKQVFIPIYFHLIVLLMQQNPHYLTNTAKSCHFVSYRIGNGYFSVSGLKSCTSVCVPLFHEPFWFWSVFVPMLLLVKVFL